MVEGWNFLRATEFCRAKLSNLQGCWKNSSSGVRDVRLEPKGNAQEGWNRQTRSRTEFDIFRGGDRLGN